MAQSGHLYTNRKESLTTEEKVTDQVLETERSTGLQSIRLKSRRKDQGH